MRKEEEFVMPHAHANLTAQDWAEIEAAFAANRDPLAGDAAAEDFAKLFSRRETAT